MGYSSLLSLVGVYYASNLLSNYMQVAWFTLVWWYMYLDSCAKNHTKFVTWLMDNVADADTIMVGNCNTEVTSSYLKVYDGKFYLWVNENGMENLLSIPCLKEEGYHI